MVRRLGAVERRDASEVTEEEEEDWFCLVCLHGAFYLSMGLRVPEVSGDITQIYCNIVQTSEQLQFCKWCQCIRT